MSDQENCPICLSKINNGVILDCGHSFCSLCLDRWLMTGSRQCPFCRGSIILDAFYPGPEVIDLTVESDEDQDEFEVERILDHTGYGRSIRYLVLWATGETTWEPRANLTDCEDVILEYRRRRAVRNVQRFRHMSRLRAIYQSGGQGNRRNRRPRAPRM